jgi:hypothetical protein
MAKISMRNLIKTGFGISVGMFLAQMIFMVIGIIFFISGYMLYKNVSNDNEKKSNGFQIGGIILMGLGVVVMGGIGFTYLMEAVNDMDF